MLPVHTQSFTHLYKHAVQIDVRAYAHALPLDPFLPRSLSHTHTHTHSRTPTRSQSYTTTCQYCGQAFIKPLHTHSPLAIFGRRTMRNDSKMEMCDMFPYKATLNPTSVFSLSVCTRLVVQSSEKKAPAYKKLSGNDSRPPKPGL